MARLVVAGPAKLDVQEILTKLSQVAGYPPHVRIRVVQPFVVVYDHNGDEATILRVVDGRRQITPELLGRR
jgi:hypothetical protein